MQPNAEMPRRCVKCNQPADEPTKARKVYWYSPWLYLLLLLNLLIFAVVALLVRKSAIVVPGLCAEHKRRRARGVAIGWVGFLSGFVVMFLGMDSALGVWGVLLGLLVMLASTIVGMRFGRIVYATRIDKSYVRLRGCGEPFLDSLAPFPGERRA